MSNFQPLEIVGRGSETQLQVGENIAGKGLMYFCTIHLTLSVLGHLYTSESDVL